MTGRRFTRALPVALLTALLIAAPAHSSSPAGSIEMSFDRTRIATKLGDKFVFRSTIANRGSAPATGLIAHLNILSLRRGVYVDPEDWSSNRTRYLGTIPAGGSVTIAWHMQAVNAGSFGVYVAVVEQSRPTRPPVTGPAIELGVAGRKTLNSGGILSLALGVPALIGLIALGNRLRRRAA